MFHISAKLGAFRFRARGYFGFKVKGYFKFRVQSFYPLPEAKFFTLCQNQNSFCICQLLLVFAKIKELRYFAFPDFDNC